MIARRVLVGLAASALVLGVGACALDFDRFEPGTPQMDASLAASADSPNGGGLEDAGADVVTEPVQPMEDAGTEDVQADAGSLSDGSLALDGSSCTPSPPCLTSARSCAATCTQQDQQCTMRCTGGAGAGCRSSCNRTESTCLMQCDATCSTCTRSAGCAATAACADAAR